MKRLTGRNKETGEAYLFNGIGGINEAIDRLAQYEDAEEVENTTYKACLGTKCIPCKPTFPECKFCDFAKGENEKTEIVAQTKLGEPYVYFSY